MNAWNYEPAADLDQPTIERLRRFPREPDMIVYGLRSVVALVLRGWLKLYHRLEIAGGEHLPKEGSFIMAANHASHLDTLCLLAALPLRKLHRAFPAAAQDYFFVSVPRLAVAAIVVNALPFGRRKQHPAQSRTLRANARQSGKHSHPVSRRHAHSHRPNRRIQARHRPVGCRHEHPRRPLSSGRSV